MDCDKNLRCVHCGFRIKSLYIQYSPGNIRLMKCEKCKKVADEYIECEKMGLLWKLALAFLLLDAYKILVLSSAADDWKSYMNVASLFWCYGKLLMDVLLGNLIFLCVLLVGIRILPKASFGSTSFKDVVLAILVSGYFKIFLIATMIWEFPSSVLYINDIVVLSSNTVALKVITESAMKKCLAVCLSAYAVKFLVMEMLNGGLLIFGGIDWA